MMKRLKDPIYGYIEISTDIIDKIVDTPNFQRLRDIIQTSYSPLYASAVHNRFVHSLGVYYLGKMVSCSIQETFERDNDLRSIDINRYFEIFEYACLLHDVGHAPLSHTGEKFYLDSNSSKSLHDEIKNLCNDEKLVSDIKDVNAAAPHELMSAILGLKIYSNLFVSDQEKSFFARCITGYLYQEKTYEALFLNCIIQLLNSSIIDVDKLDYLIRDAYITGFDTVVIDYDRLLKSIRILKIENNYRLVYTKNAISVIEDVIYAHDSERKWIQSHPVVLYDAYLLNHCIEVINQNYSEIKLFSYDFLTYKGKEITPELKISLLSDGDLKFLIKNIKDDPLTEEYFVRNVRRHPLWKSESEYKAIFNSWGFNDEILDIVEVEFEKISKYLNSERISGINSKAISLCENEIKKISKEMEQPDKVNYGFTLNDRKKNLLWMKALETYSSDQGIDFDFIILKSDYFNSGFIKPDFEKILISFPKIKKPCRFKTVTNVLSAQKSSRNKFFYLFYKRKNRDEKINLSQLAKYLGDLARSELSV